MTVTSKQLKVDKRISADVEIRWGTPKIIRINRESDYKLGITLVHGRIQHQIAGGEGETLGIFVKHVELDSIAGRAQQFNRGDMVLEINGLSVVNLTLEDVVSVIRNARESITFLVQTLKYPLDNDDKLKFHSKLPNNERKLEGSDATFNKGNELQCEAVVEDKSLTGEVIEAETSQVEDIGVVLTKETEPTTLSEAESSEASESPDNLSINELDIYDENEYTEVASHNFGKEAVAPINNSATASEKVKKKYACLGHTIMMVQLERGENGLGLSLAGHKDRSCMAVFVCGLNPNGAAYRKGDIQVGDEILEVNGVVLHGRCHLNASAIIKGLAGPLFNIVILRRKTAVNDLAVRPVTQFPVLLKEETLEDRFASYPNVRNVTVEKGKHNLGIMIIEGKHSELGQGIFISDIQEGSAAEKAGLEIGEMILAVNNNPLLDADYDMAAKFLKQAEGVVTLILSNPSKKICGAANDISKAQDPTQETKMPPPTSTTPTPTVLKSGPPSRITTPVSEAVVDPLTCPIMNAKNNPIEVATDNQGLGVVFAGDKNGQYVAGIIIIELFTGGAAYKDGRLQPGDQILELNGVSLKDVTHETAMQTLRQKLPKMKLLVFRPEKIEYETIEVDLVKKPGKGLGLSIIGKQCGNGAYVSEILEGGVSDIDGRIMKGDVLASINGQNMENMTIDEVGVLIKTINGKVTIKFHRYKPVLR